MSSKLQLSQAANLQHVIGPLIRPAGMDIVYDERVQPVVALARYVQQQCSSGAAMSASTGSFTEPFCELSLEQRAAMWLQNRQSYKNSDRRELIESGRYIDAIRQPTQILEREWVALVLFEVQSRLAKVSSPYSTASARHSLR